jgi:hypothetical protein
VKRSLVLLALAVGACSPDANPVIPARLDRPIDVTFGCLGPLPDDEAGRNELVALPTSGCRPNPTLPPGLEPGTSAGQFAIVLQSARGEIAVSLDLNGLDDADDFSPGFNGISVGSLPIGIDTTSDGCWAVTANAGSCDISTIDIETVHRLDPRAVQTRGLTLNGEPFLVRPSSIATPPPPAAIAAIPDCSATIPPEGTRTAWIAFGSCGLVARVDLPTGKILGGVQFSAGGPAAIVGPEAITCPEAEVQTCSPRKLPAELDGGVPEGSSEPVALAFDPSGTRLYVGSLSSPDLLAVDLGPDGVPTALGGVTLEGAQGIDRLAATGLVEMGQNGAMGDHAYVYAAARDGSIHVVDVTGSPVECDTQIDRRALHRFSNLQRLACFKVGDPANPPRRPGARGPGIRLPNDVPARDLAVLVKNELPNNRDFDDSPDPRVLNGTFVLATTDNAAGGGTRGIYYVINVDNDNYEDIENDFLAASDIQLGIPHSLREGTVGRRDELAACGAITNSTGIGQPRLSDDPDRTAGPAVNFTSGAGSVFAPMLALEECPELGLATFALAGGSSRDTRQVAFPDLGQLPASVAYTVSWEGVLSADSAVSRRPGGDVSVGGGTMVVKDDSALNCDLGVRPGDIVRFMGCTSDGDCGRGDVCYTHPDAPSGIDGLCIPEDEVVDLSSICRDFMVSQRRFTAVDVRADRLTVIPRPKQLEATPIEGCDSAVECTELEDAELERRENDAGIPVGSVQRHTWTCAEEPTIGPRARCLMTCEASDDCTPGSVCSSGRCVLGSLPPPECVASLQRIEPRAGDSFSVLSNVTGYRHPMIRDDVGQCVVDPTASPLLRSRFTKYEPDCGAILDDPFSNADPNPCSFSREQPVLDTTGDIVARRQSTMTRLRLPELTLDVADTAVPIPSIPNKTYSPLLDGYFFRFRLNSGFTATFAGISAVQPVRVRVAPSNIVIVVDAGDARRRNDGVLLGGQLIKMGIDALLVDLVFN